MAFEHSRILESRPLLRPKAAGWLSRTIPIMTLPSIPRGVHDLGGLPAGPVAKTEHDYAPWEKRVDALLILLSKKDCRQMTVDELRRNIETLGPDAYDTMTYYERWMHS